MKNSYSYFENRDCKYFPCHEKEGEYFNCLFCYCPLYTLGDKCGGNFFYTDNGVKDCSKCIIPHCEKGYDYVNSKSEEIIDITKGNSKKLQTTKNEKYQ